MADIVDDGNDIAEADRKYRELVIRNKAATPEAVATGFCLTCYEDKVHYLTEIE